MKGEEIYKAVNDAQLNLKKVAKEYILDFFNRHNITSLDIDAQYNQKGFIVYPSVFFANGVEYSDKYPCILKRVWIEYGEIHAEGESVGYRQTDWDTEDFDFTNGIHNLYWLADDLREIEKQLENGAELYEYEDDEEEEE